MTGAEAHIIQLYSASAGSSGSSPGGGPGGRPPSRGGGPSGCNSSRVSSPSLFLSSSVTDNGPGVPADELPRIFEPFHRLDLARSRETGGSGLGLAIVRSAMEACGGEVQASLPAVGGLRITLRLPKASGLPACA